MSYLFRIGPTTLGHWFAWSNMPLFASGGFHLFCHVLFVFDGGLSLLVTLVRYWLIIVDLVLHVVGASMVASKYVRVGIIFFSDGLFVRTRVVHTIPLEF
jgi:hypothetical protein